MSPPLAPLHPLQHFWEQHIFSFIHLHHAVCSSSVGRIVSLAGPTLVTFSRLAPIIVSLSLSLLLHSYFVNGGTVLASLVVFAVIYALRGVVLHFFLIAVRLLLVFCSSHEPSHVMQSLCAIARSSFHHVSLCPIDRGVLDCLVCLAMGTSIMSYNTCGCHPAFPSAGVVCAVVWG